jgi:hypothetical protein
LTRPRAPRHARSPAARSLVGRIPPPARSRLAPETEGPPPPQRRRTRRTPTSGSRAEPRGRSRSRGSPERALPARGRVALGPGGDRTGGGVDGDPSHLTAHSPPRFRCRTPPDRHRGCSPLLPRRCRPQGIL